MYTVRRLLPLTILFGLVFLFPPPARGQAEYTVQKYDAVFELVPGRGGKLCDAAVTLEITYDVKRGSKDSGFKFIGTLPVRDVSVTDGEDRPLRFKLEKLRENKITWYFPSVSRGRQTVVVYLTLVGALQGSLEENRLNFDWITRWKVPVYDVTYSFILPKDHELETLESKPGHGKVIQYEDCRSLDVHLDRLRGRGFSVRFSPGVAEGTVHKGKGSSGGYDHLFWGFLGFVFLGLVSLVKGRGRGGGGDVSGGCGGAGCGGGCGGCGGCGG